MAIDWRPLTTVDVPTWADLLRRVEIVDRRGENYSLADLGQQLTDPRIDLPRASVAVLEAGRLIGYGLIRFRPSGSSSLVANFEGAVDPDYRRRGIGRQLVDWFKTRASAVGAEDFPQRTIELRSHASDSNTGYAALLTASGFRPVRWLLDLERALHDAIPTAKAPEGMVVTEFAAQPQDAVRVARNEAFAGHWGSVDLSPQDWERFVGAPSFRPDLSYLMLDRTSIQVVGLLLASYYEADTVATGLREVWIHDVGTRRAARGRGVASALVTHALGAYHRCGYQRASLSADSENPTGAPSFYAQAGFAIAHRWTVYSCR